MQDNASAVSVVPDYPTRPVRLIEPFGAGGGVDILASALAEKLSELWGQPVTVENHSGGGSTAAPALVATSPPDGYTLLVNTSAHAYSATLVTDLPYDPLHDFIPVAPLTGQAYVLVAGKTAGVRTLGELITAGKARPGELTFASAGGGTGTHVGVEQFNREAGITAIHVPASPTDAIVDTIAKTAAGHTDYAMSPIAIAAPHIRSGQLVALGVSGARRSALLPEVPTIAEAGVAGFDFPIWYGLWAPAGTSDAVVHKLANDVSRALAVPDLRDWLAAHGAHQIRMTQAKFASFVLAESERGARIVKGAATMLE